MDNFFIGIYRDQILEQVESAKTAYGLIINSGTEMNVFESIHHFIIHVSNVVKLVQPKISGDLDFKNYRMKNLRNKYPKLPDIDQSLIFIRNDFEHFDERIDNWVINSKRHNYVDSNLGNINAIKGLDPKDNFRQYDPENKTLYFCGKEYPLEKLYDYIKNIEAAL